MKKSETNKNSNNKKKERIRPLLFCGFNLVKKKSLDGDSLLGYQDSNLE